MKYDVPWVYFFRCSMSLFFSLSFLCLRLCVRVFASWMMCVCVWYIFLSFFVSFRIFLVFRERKRSVYFFHLNQPTLYVTANLFALNAIMAKKNIKHSERPIEKYTRRKTMERRKNMREMLNARLNFLILFSFKLA